MGTIILMRSVRVKTLMLVVDVVDVDDGRQNVTVLLLWGEFGVVMFGDDTATGFAGEKKGTSNVIGGRGVGGRGVLLCAFIRF